MYEFPIFIYIYIHTHIHIYTHIYTHTYTGIPTFKNATFCHFTFTKDLLYQYLFSLTEKKNPKKIFTFMKKGENRVQHLFAASCYRGSAYPKQQEQHRQAPSPATTLSISASGRHSFLFVVCFCFFSNIPTREIHLLWLLSLH